MAIPRIQGSAHESPLTGRAVRTSGIVTAVVAHGFYIQDPAGDGDPATSDGLFVYTGSAAHVTVGDRLEVEGTVTEFVPGGVATGNLSITELTQPSLRLVERDDALPEAIDLEAEKSWPPSSSVAAAADFLESIESMRVRVPRAVTVSPLDGHGEVFVRPAGATGVAGLNERGGMTVAGDDFNPERLQLQFDGRTSAAYRQQIDTGAGLRDVRGVIGYAFGNYEVRVDAPFSLQPARIERERTALAGSSVRLTIATFNLKNLSPLADDRGRHDMLARQIAVYLQHPDILALQEIQDDDGAADSGRTAATRLMQQMIERLVTAGAPRYRYADLPPRDGADGGEPGSNIRSGFLYDPARVTLVDGSLRRLDAADARTFARSRKPLLAEFRFNGRPLTLINVHLSSKRGSTPLFGRVQPPIDGHARQREAQAEFVAGEIRRITAADPGARIVVLGDFNDFGFSRPLQTLAATGLVNLLTTLPDRERYTYVYEGNSEALDHVLVSEPLSAGAEIDIVHVNAEFGLQASDHDPVVVRLSPGS